MGSIRGLFQIALAANVALAVALGACTGVVDGPAGPGNGPDDPDDPIADVGVGSLGLRTLVGWQYRNAIRDLLGDEAAAATTPPDDVALHGFATIGTGQLTITVDRASIYQTAAYAAADAALASSSNRDELLGCAPSSPTDEACLRQFVTDWGRRAWRRPLEEEEIAAWVALGVEAGGATESFDEALRFIVAGFLQAPSFLYQVGVGAADGERARLTGYEMAARLSFFLTGTTPDDALLDAAGRGELDTATGVEREALRLLESPAAITNTERYFGEVLGWSALDDMERDPVLYPDFDADLAGAMREETRRFLEELIWTNDGDFRDFFRGDYTYVDDRLASLYGLPAPDAAGFSRISFGPESPRAGVLGQASFLAVSSRAARTSPTTRGRLIRLRFLCEAIPPPPADVATSFPEDDPSDPPQTARDRLVRHRADPSCAGCHEKMDDLGLGLETFDAVGVFRETENGADIDARSVFDDLGSFEGARELGALLADDPRTSECLVQNLFRTGTGRLQTGGEGTLLREVRDVFAREGHSFRALLVALVTSDAFRYSALPEGVKPEGLLPEGDTP
jgi:PAS domain-containing protein